jgi:hypothetical protein
MAEIVDPFAMECSTLLAHRREQYPDPSAPARDELRDRRALGQRHADAIDGDVLAL